MSLPSTFLDELRARLSLGQVVGRKVVWDARKSNPAKGDLWASCPFHQEKSASFHVDDRKGFYYCFGCHAKGDAIAFVRETENVGFMEAIEILAREAGMPMPARDPKAQEKADRRGRLSEAVEAAVRHYRLMLRTGAAAAARDYLARRRLDEAAQERFGIGFAPGARQGLLEALRQKGFDEDTIVAAGLCARPEGGGAPYDRFRDRIVFPIRDARGRAISLGGRALDPNAPAKYLNGPETDLFDKGRSLYNHGPAREAAGRGLPLVVAEGYMDVIALVGAGFEAAVAPLGTAITEEQLRLLWRIHPEPLVAMDGDRAGIAAAMRLVDLALPLVEAGQSLRFALMPSGKDPDDVLREGGAAAMRTILDAAEPMVALLWRRETEGRVFDSPERRAALDRRLREALGRIADASLRAHYGEEIRRLRWSLFGAGGRAPAQGRGWSPRGPGAGASPLPGTARSLLGLSSEERVEERKAQEIILALGLRFPDLVAAFIDEFEDLEAMDPTLAAIREALVRHAGSDGAEPGTVVAAVSAAAGGEAVEKLLAAPHVVSNPSLYRGARVEIARMTLAEQFARRAGRIGLVREIEEAEIDIGGLADEGLTWRIRQAAETADRAARSQSEDRIEYELAPNGLRLRRNERGALDDLLAGMGYPQVSDTDEENAKD